jgi:hypothetical protein
MQIPIRERRRRLRFKPGAPLWQIAKWANSIPILSLDSIIDSAVADKLIVQELL